MNAPAAGASEKADMLWVELCSGAGGEKLMLPFGRKSGGDRRHEQRTLACHAACVMPNPREPGKKGGARD